MEVYKNDSRVVPCGEYWVIVVIIKSEWREAGHPVNTLTYVDNTFPIRELLKKHEFCLNRGYAMTKIDGRLVPLHVLIKGPLPLGQVIMHANRDPLDNREENLKCMPLWVKETERGMSADDGTPLPSWTKRSRGSCRAYFRCPMGGVVSKAFPDRRRGVAASERAAEAWLAAMTASLAIPSEFEYPGMGGGTPVKWGYVDEVAVDLTVAAVGESPLPLKRCKMMSIEFLTS
jgi:hypothetical protein